MSNPAATDTDLLSKFRAITSGTPEEEKESDEELAQQEPADEFDEDEDEDTSDETDDPSKPETIEKRKRKLRLKKLKRKHKARAYEFSGGTDCVGIIFVEIGKVTDLPPERNGKHISIIIGSRFL